jgi:p-aminobenzoyl-glutamate transporter AbgT
MSIALLIVAALLAAITTGMAIWGGFFDKTTKPNSPLYIAVSIGMFVIFLAVLFPKPTIHIIQSLLDR